MLTWGAWGGRLQKSEFLAREKRLRAHPWCRSGMLTWLWVDPAGKVLSSCETFTSSSYLGGAAGRSYSVASVFTEQSLRGQGHAARMMDALVSEVRRSDPLAHAITLYSDVGARLYERSGFVGAPAFDVEFEPSEGDPAEAVDALLPETVFALPDPPDEPFVIWPSGAQLDWHLERERFYAQALKRPRLHDLSTGQTHHGARAGASRVYWAADFKNERLMVTLITEPTRPAVELLILAARRAAHRLGLQRVSLWENDTLPMLAGLPGAQRTERDGSLPMIAPLRAGLTPSQWRIRPRALWV